MPLRKDYVILQAITWNSFTPKITASHTANIQAQNSRFSAVQYFHDLFPHLKLSQKKKMQANKFSYSSTGPGYYISNYCDMWVIVPDTIYIYADSYVFGCF